jgi:hypothetical protein
MGGSWERERAGRETWQEDLDWEKLIAFAEKLWR